MNNTNNVELSAKFNEIFGIFIYFTRFDGILMGNDLSKSCRVITWLALVLE